MAVLVAVAVLADHLGGDGTTTSWNAPATAGAGGGTGGPPCGDGAPGTAIGATTNLDGSNNDGGSGGGADGLGIIVVHGVTSGGCTTPDARLLLFDGHMDATNKHADSRPRP